jgi:putative transposase
LTQATLHGWALGGADFVADLQKKTERRVSKTPAGRPVKINRSA